MKDCALIVKYEFDAMVSGFDGKFKTEKYISSVLDYGQTDELIKDVTKVARRFEGTVTFWLAKYTDGYSTGDAEVCAVYGDWMKSVLTWVNDDATGLTSDNATRMVEGTKMWERSEDDNVIPKKVIKEAVIKALKYYENVSRDIKEAEAPVEKTEEPVEDVKPEAPKKKRSRSKKTEVEK